MVAINFTAGATTAKTNVPFTVAMSTNNNVIANGSTITFKQPGIYEIMGTVTLNPSAAGAYDIGLYQDDTLVGNVSTFYAADGAQPETLPIYTVVNIEATNTSDYVQLTFLTTNAPTIVNGSVAIKKIS